MAGLTLKNVMKAYGETRVIESIDLDIEDGEFVVFVEPSGCGKSTLLIAGLEEISGGDISIGDELMNEVAPAKVVLRWCSRLTRYPHMTVYKNMAFGLKQAKMLRIRSTSVFVRLRKSWTSRHCLSVHHSVVWWSASACCDWPCDCSRTESLPVRRTAFQPRCRFARSDTYRDRPLHERLGTTMIYVTHDQVEAMTLADKIVVLRGGDIEQVGSPIKLYEEPENMFVAQFIGSPKMNFFDKKDLTEKVPKQWLLTTLWLACALSI